ncbi:hypothetical protein Aph02nite_29600 [Actinoplanes philippinensis]|uniref:Uncharacterized protein n=1 Tax=Actinoplanes philippinensis TaxID=35752 RepID=A0A1I2EI58_9ACTN|nr:DUF6412 domain-containing protein [Actinoplanes philippinensis]GIE77010.1 hypothetical protein Aph02nite_29600 [Actinoplanes philippinensis]SFE91940.1 hypothetical protein SAMN05421541_104448 [Actinoplanes philippinensis]
MKWWDALWRLVSMLAEATGSSDLASGASALVGVVLIAVLARVLLVRRAPSADGHATAGALRTRAVRTGVPRHRDPDASGRTRPRGPTAAPAAA